MAVPGVDNQGKGVGVEAKTKEKQGDNGGGCAGEIQEDQEEDLGDKCKWLISRLMNYLRNNGINTDKLWREMKALMLRTLSVLIGQTEAHPCLFELFGFDILLDQDCTHHLPNLLIFFSLRDFFGFYIRLSITSTNLDSHKPRHFFFLLINRQVSVI